MRRESAEAEWFWIGHEQDNDASERGIMKAGFRSAGHVWFLRSGELGFIGCEDATRELAHGAARALGLKHLHTAPGESHAPAMHEGNGEEPKG